MIAVQAVSTTAFGTGNTLTLNKPTGTVDGNYLLAFIVNEGGQTVNSVPSGWALLQEDSEANGDFIRIYWKQASSEGVSWQWGFNASTERMGGVIRIDGQIPTNANDQNNENDQQNTRTPTYTNTITPTYADSLLVMAIVANDVSNIDSTAYSIATSNPTWTERIALFDSGTGLALLVATAVRPETTATGSSSATIGSAGTPDSACILASFTAITNATATPAVVTMSLSVPSPTASGSATATPAVVTMALTPPTPSASVGVPDWTNTDKSSTSSFTNLDKS